MYLLKCTNVVFLYWQTVAHFFTFITLQLKMHLQQVLFHSIKPKILSRKWSKTLFQYQIDDVSFLNGGNPATENSFARQGDVEELCDVISGEMKGGAGDDEPQVELVGLTQVAFSYVNQSSLDFLLDHLINVR